MAVLPSDPAAVPSARRLARSWLGVRGLDALRRQVELVVSELVANAVTYGRGPILLRLAREADCIRVQVEDHGGGQPTLRQAAAEDASRGGWGLRMVNHLADAWGTDVTDGHTVVWTKHRLPATTRPRPPGH